MESYVERISAIIHIPGLLNQLLRCGITSNEIFLPQYDTIGYFRIPRVVIITLFDDDLIFLYKMLFQKFPGASLVLAGKIEQLTAQASCEPSSHPPVLPWVRPNVGAIMLWATAIRKRVVFYRHSNVTRDTLLCR